MGQTIGCDLDCQATPGAARSRSWSSHATQQRYWGQPDEMSRWIEQLELELRQLKDDNFRAREETLRCGKGGDADIFGRRNGRTGSGPVPVIAGGGDVDGGIRACDRRVDLEQQLTYMRELVRGLQLQNQRLVGTDLPSQHGGGDVVDEADYRRLQQKMMTLQQAHLNQLQEARQLQLKSPWLNTPGVSPGHWGGSGNAGSFHGLTRPTAGSGLSGMSTPGLGGSATPGSQLQHLQSQYQTLVAEQEQLRSKVRHLAHNH